MLAQDGEKPAHLKSCKARVSETGSVDGRCAQTVVWDSMRWDDAGPGAFGAFVRTCMTDTIRFVLLGSQHLFGEWLERTQVQKREMRRGCCKNQARDNGGLRHSASGGGEEKWLDSG